MYLNSRLTQEKMVMKKRSKQKMYEVVADSILFQRKLLTVEGYTLKITKSIK